MNISAFNRHIILYLIIMVLVCQCEKLAAQQVADSVDVLHYELCADLGKTTPRLMVGDATLTMVKLTDIDTVTLDLQGATVNGVWVNGDSTEYAYNNRFLHFPLTTNIGVGDTFSVRVLYRTSGYVENYGFGGLHMDNGLYYNLGAAISANPHPMGRTVLPCRDNFHDKATYRLTVTTAPGWRSVCSGQLQSNTINADSSSTAVWNLQEDIPTYILSLSAAPFSIIRDTVAGDSTLRSAIGENINIPVSIGYLNKDSSQVAQAFEMLHDVVPAFERHFGPYRWHTIGYIGTPWGSMEHANNIHLTGQCIASIAPACQSTAIHEFAHSWFGNLITCRTADDMWFNEGGASFCEEVGFETAYDKATANNYFREKMDRTQRTAHEDDGGWYPLYAQSWQNVYGTTTYQKGACVWHSLRSYLGDTLFYASMRTFFLRNAFGTISSQNFRDSLSAISGINLTDFFQFHVFTPGFQDFDIETMRNTATNTYQLSLRQTLRGTTVLGKSCKVPVTFFDKNLHAVKRTFFVSGNYVGEDTSQFTISSLPFTPAFAVVDLDKDYGYAGNADTITLATKGNHAMPLCHFTANVHSLGDSTVFLAVTHHFTEPHTPTESRNPGIVRTTQRYWTIDGLLPGNSLIYGFFYYHINGTNESDAHLDDEVCLRATSFDSLQLLYRPNATSPWQAIGSRHNGNNSSGYFYTTRLRRGEYTIGIVDTATLDINTGATSSSLPAGATFSPNPSEGSFIIHTNNIQNNFTVEIRNAQGTLVYEQDECHNDSIINAGLQKGVYVVTLLPIHAASVSGKVVIK